MKNELKIKVCGTREFNNVAALVTLNPDFVGFIFYKGSKRYIGKNPDRKVFSAIPNNIKKVGVFVDEDPELLRKIQIEFNLDMVQLHGNESVNYCRHLSESGISVMKVFGIQGQPDFREIEKYLPYCQYLLYDTHTSNYGGSGRKFNWEILKNSNLGHPFFLSGGIGPDDYKTIRDLEIPNMFGIDINSKFEISPGLKNIGLIENFLKNLNT